MCVVVVDLLTEWGYQACTIRCFVLAHYHKDSRS